MINIKIVQHCWLIIVNRGFKNIEKSFDQYFSEGISISCTWVEHKFIVENNVVLNMCSDIPNRLNELSIASFNEKKKY